MPGKAKAHEASPRPVENRIKGDTLCALSIHGFLLTCLFLTMFYLVRFFADIYSGGSPALMRPFMRVLKVSVFFHKVSVGVIPLALGLLWLDKKLLVLICERFGRLRARRVSRIVTIVILSLFVYSVWATQEPLFHF